MRITGGTLRNRPIATLTAKGLRPTSDKTRERLFSMLTARGVFTPPPEVVLDLCAGSGALGIEALSRGANQAIFIEQDKDRCQLIRQNATALNLEPQTKILRRNAWRLTKPPPNTPKIALVLFDPPYQRKDYQKVLTQLTQQKWLTPNATIALETEKTTTPTTPPENFTQTTQRDDGRTRLVLFTREP